MSLRIHERVTLHENRYVSRYPQQCLSEETQGTHRPRHGRKELQAKRAACHRQEARATLSYSVRLTGPGVWVESPGLDQRDAAGEGSSRPPGCPDAEPSSGPTPSRPTPRQPLARQPTAPSASLAPCQYSLSSHV